MAMKKKCRGRMRRVKALSTAALAIVLVCCRQHARRKKLLWVKLWVERRPTQGALDNLLVELDTHTHTGTQDGVEEAGT